MTSAKGGKEGMDRNLVCRGRGIVLNTEIPHGLRNLLVRDLSTSSHVKHAKHGDQVLVLKHRGDGLVVLLAGIDLLEFIHD